MGGGLWLDDKPYRGTRGLAAEIGHLTIDINGPDCPCGGKGHLEAYLGFPAISALAREAAERPRGVAIYDAAGSKLEAVNARSLVIAAAGGDEYALELLRELGAKLGEALVGLVNIFNPQIVCIGGGIGESADELAKAAAEVVHTRALAGRKDVKVIQATLGNDAGVLGAAALAFDEYESREGFKI